MAKCIACGIMAGTALGAAAAVMIKSKHHHCCKGKKSLCLRDKAASTMDTVCTFMQNLCDMAR